MRIAKKIDRAFQWAGERMGGEAKTTHSDDFKMLEMEMSLRNDGTWTHISLRHRPLLPQVTGLTRLLSPY